jgi:hypothetical protein
LGYYFKDDPNVIGLVTNLKGIGTSLRDWWSPTLEQQLAAVTAEHKKVEAAIPNSNNNPHLVEQQKALQKEIERLEAAILLAKSKQ